MTSRLRNALALLVLPLRIYLGVVFVLASLYKIAEPAEFALSIATYEILPLGLINLMALLLPWIEVVVGIGLIVGFWTRANALAVIGMMAMFMVALGIALNKDLQMSCGCFASAEAGDEISALTMWRDLAWLAGGLVVLLADDGRFGLDGWLKRVADKNVDPGPPKSEN